MTQDCLEISFKSIQFSFSHDQFRLVLMLTKPSIWKEINLDGYKSSPHVTCRTNYFHFYLKKIKSFYRHEEYVRPPRYMQLSGSLYWHHMGEALASTQITQRSTAPLSDLGCSSDRGFNHTEGKVRALWCPTGVPPLTLIPFSKHISDRVVGFSIHYGSCVQLGLHTGEGKNSAKTKWAGLQHFFCQSCALKRSYGMGYLLKRCY